MTTTLVLLGVIVSAWFWRSIRRAVANLWGMPQSVLAESAADLAAVRARITEQLREAGEKLEYPGHLRIQYLLGALAATAFAALFVYLEYQQTMPALAGLLDEEAAAPARFAPLAGAALVATAAFSTWTLHELGSSRGVLFTGHLSARWKKLATGTSALALAGALAAGVSLAVYRANAIAMAGTTPEPAQPGELVVAESASGSVPSLENQASPPVAAPSAALAVTVVALAFSLLLVAAVAFALGPVALIMSSGIWVAILASAGLGLLAIPLTVGQRLLAAGYGVTNGFFTLLAAMGTALTRPLIAFCRMVHDREMACQRPRAWTVALTSWAWDTEIPGDPIGERGLPAESTSGDQTESDQDAGSAPAAEDEPAEEPSNWSPFHHDPTGSPVEGAAT
jgi:hypothetical protein